MRTLLGSPRLALTFVLGTFMRAFSRTASGAIGVLLVPQGLVTFHRGVEPPPGGGSRRWTPIPAQRIEGRAMRWLAVVDLVVSAAGVLLWPRDATDAGIAPPLLVYGLLLVVALASPFLIGPLGRLAGLPFAALFGVEERLARGALARDRSRTALTVGALTVGLALVVAIGTVALDARRSETAWIEGVVPGDVLLTTVTPVSRGDDGPIPEIAAIPRRTGVGDRHLPGRVPRAPPRRVSGVRGRHGGDELTFVSGTDSASRSDAGGAIVLQAQAERLDLAVGDTMSVAGGSGATVELAVAGIVERGLPSRGGEAVLVGWRDAGETFGIGGADVLAVRYRDGAAESAGPVVAELATSLGLQPVPLERVEGAISDALDRVFGLFDALALVAVVVAALGIVNTLTMDVVERVREIGILRAVGMTRRQVGRMVVVEAGILGVIGALLGIAAGLLAAAVMLMLAGGRSGRPSRCPGRRSGSPCCWASGSPCWPPTTWLDSAGRLSIIRAVQASSHPPARWW
jgi:putative ABC transport system permease protein